MAAFTFAAGKYVTETGEEYVCRVRSDKIAQASVNGYATADGSEVEMPPNFRMRRARVKTVNGNLHSVICYTPTASLYATKGTHCTIQEGSGTPADAYAYGREGEHLRARKSDYQVAG